MLRSITVENYRGFRSKSVLKLKPLTVLLGRNSSGKSSLTRIIPLLQQSLERQTSSPILWSSDSVDLGNISDVINHSETSSELRIGISVSEPRLAMFLSRANFLGSHRGYSGDNAELEYTIRLSAEGHRTKFNGVEVRYGAQILSADWDNTGRLKMVKVDGKQYDLNGATYSVDVKSLFPEINRSYIKEEVTRSRRLPIFYDPLLDALKGIVHGRTAADKVDFSARNLSFVPKVDAGEALKDFPNVVKQKLSPYNVNLISDLSMINDFPQIMRHMELIFGSIFRGSAYIGPSRASGKRFDRVQELAVNRLNSSGDNTAMYIYSLDDEEKHSFNELLVRACGHALIVEESGPGHVSIKVGRQGQGHFENIADVGFGFSQLIPVVAQLHAVRERSDKSNFNPSMESLFAVEQPELHLHPAMQANLADLFAGAIRPSESEGRTTTIILETHSETLISQLGILVASGELSKDSVAVYFVSKDENLGEATIKEMAFNEEGIIGDWPIGFFSAV